MTKEYGPPWDAEASVLKGFFCGFSDCNRVYFRLEEIASIETPGANLRPPCWVEWIYAFVQIKGMSGGNGIGLDKQQWEQLKAALQ